MKDENFGLSIELKLQFAFPTGDGKWMLREGVLTTVDGLQHKFAFPGFETQAPPGMGLTATYHIGQNLRKDHAVLLCDITQIVAVNGKVEAKIPQADAVKVILAHVIP